MKKVEIARDLVQTFLRRGARIGEWRIIEGLGSFDILVAARFNRDSRNLELFFSESAQEVMSEPFFPVTAGASSCRVIVQEMPE